jgi:hypothetical protein
MARPFLPFLRNARHVPGRFGALQQRSRSWETRASCNGTGSGNLACVPAFLHCRCHASQRGTTVSKTAGTPTIATRRSSFRLLGMASPSRMIYGSC